jgi:hypothetical protein
MFTLIFFRVFLCGTRAQNLTALFSYTLYNNFLTYHVVTSV